MSQDRLLLSIGEAAARLSLGRTTMYNLVMHGDISSLRIGGRRLIPATALEEFVQRVQQEQNPIEGQPITLPSHITPPTRLQRHSGQERSHK